MREQYILRPTDLWPKAKRLRLTKHCIRVFAALEEKNVLSDILRFVRVFLLFVADGLELSSLLLRFFSSYFFGLFAINSKSVTYSIATKLVVPMVVPMVVPIVSCMY